MIKIMHRLLNVKYYLKSVGIENDNLCKCGEVETVEHALIFCKANNDFIYKCKKNGSITKIKLIFLSTHLNIYFSLKMMELIVS